MQSGTLKKKKKILNSRIKNKNIQIFFCNNSTNVRVSRIQERN